MENPVVFTLRGQFAHWRKGFTTTSPLTYSFPPRTALIGLIGAILGIQRDDIPKAFQRNSTRTAVCPAAPITKDMLPENWFQSPIRLVKGKFVDFDKGLEHFQVDLEVIRSPFYRVIFWHKDNSLMRTLVKRLKEKEWYYTPYLGILGFLADIEFQKEDRSKKVMAKEFELHSVLPLKSEELPLDLSLAENCIREERIPLEVLPGRIFNYLPIAYIEPRGRPFYIKSKRKNINYFHLEKENINVIWLETPLS